MAQGERVITAVPGEEGGVPLHVRHMEHALERMDAMSVEQGPASLLKGRHVTFRPQASDVIGLLHLRDARLAPPMSYRRSTLPTAKPEEKADHARPVEVAAESCRREFHLPRLGQEGRPLRRQEVAPSDGSVEFLREPRQVVGFAAV